MDQFLKLLKNRVSCRAYTSQDIPSKEIEEIVDTALHTASGGGLQPYSIIEIRAPKTKERLCALSRKQSFIKHAPVLMMLCIDYNRINKMKAFAPFPERHLEEHFNLWMSVFDVGLLSQNLTLAAENKGIKSICVGNFFNYMEEVSDLLNLPQYVLPCMLMCFGYPKFEAQQPVKYSSHHILHHEKYDDPSLEEVKQSFQDKYGDFSMPLSEERLELFKNTARDFKCQQSYEYAQTLTVGKEKLNYYQFWLGAFFEPLEDAMVYTDYQKFLKSKGFNWLEVKNET